MNEKRGMDTVVSERKEDRKFRVIISFSIKAETPLTDESSSGNKLEFIGFFVSKKSRLGVCSY